MTGRRDDAPGIELWNVADGVTTLVGAQERFLVLGRVDRVGEVERLTHSFNGGPEIPVVFRAVGEPPKPSRLSGLGDFSIDTIDTEQLRPTNDLRLTAHGHDGSLRTRHVQLPVATLSHPETGVRLDFRDGGHPQEICQLVDGRWRHDTDRLGRPCLRISPEDAGYDRVALFTRPILAPAYTLTIRLRVDQWTAGLHNVGLVFGWRGHRPGDGVVLPRDWTTGLGYYFSHCRGLRLRVGENVQYDDAGRRVGDRILAEGELSRRRAVLARATRRLTRGLTMRQLPTGKDFWFRVRVTPQRYTLSVWPDGRPEPAPQLTAAADDVSTLPGAGGVIAHYSAVNVYEFHYEADAGTVP